MKKLDKLILKAFFGPFLITFAVVVFILLTQYMLKYFEDFVGKDLGILVFVELLFYFSLNMVPVALPLSILLSSLITFGSLGENNELTAIKTSGITLARVLFPVFIVVLMLTGAVYYFNDKIVPRANLRAYSLLYDIRQKKPALDIKPGVFYNGLPGYSVKANGKEKDGKTLKQLMIYDHTASRGNISLILADSGLMYTMMGDRYLVLDLYKGHNYTELVENEYHGKEFVRNDFASSKIVFSLASFDLNRTQVELFSQNKMMRTVAELATDIDSMKRDLTQLEKTLPINLTSYYYYLGKRKELVEKPVPFRDSSYSVPMAEVTTLALNQARNIKSFASGYADRTKADKRETNIWTVERLRKFTQTMACLALFLIGAPLGAIIRKGGLGIPVLISISFFIVYYVLSITGEKWAKEGVSNIYYSMWYANAVLFAIGLFFVNQARRDVALFEFQVYRRLFKRLFSRAKTV